MGKTMRFVVIEQNADIVIIDHDADTKGGTLKMLQTAVDGLIECVSADPDFLGFDADVWINEDGLYRKGYQVNVIASVIAGQRLVGPAVLSLSTFDGETIGLDAEQIDDIKKRTVVRTRSDGKGYNVGSLATLRALNVDVSDCWRILERDEDGQISTVTFTTTTQLKTQEKNRG